MKPLFADRFDAGKRLAKELLKYRGAGVAVLAVPRGGVPIAYEIAKALEAEALEIILVRKLPIPWNPEAGFGAVSSTGEVVINKAMVDDLGLPDKEIKEITSKVLEELRRREEVYRKGECFPDLKGKTVIIADDGLASGYTMIAAVKAARKKGARKVIAAAPVAPAHTVELVSGYADEVATLWSRPVSGFAVASFYSDFPDLADEEVLGILGRG
ncbi:MAG: phosphoribosyltransferase [Candidatus Altiarchaeota archaeon]|nr:phosphoribosyltransferase [Candidatus Altiarchaeota archaeon]